MKTRKKPKKTSGIPAEEKQPEPRKSDASPEQSREGVDYGGLPQRDLKKNLGGCG